MTATLTDDRQIARTRPSGGGRERVARLERPLLLAGLALVVMHLLDLAFSGPDTSLPGVLAIVAIPVACGARPAARHASHATRPRRRRRVAGDRDSAPSRTAFTS